MASHRIQRHIQRLLDEAEEAVTSLQWHVVRDRCRAVLALDSKNGEAREYLTIAERELGRHPSDLADSIPAETPEDGIQQEKSDVQPVSREGALNDVLVGRLRGIRATVAFVLAGFVLNTGLVIFPLVLITHSWAVGLVSLAVMTGLILAAWLYQRLGLLDVSGARPLLDGEVPWLVSTVEDVSRRAGIDAPRIYISNEGNLNAYTTGTGNRTTVVFFQPLLEQLPEEEIQAVVAHEVGHIVNRDISLAVWTGAIFWWVLLVKSLAVIAARMMVELTRGFFHSEEPSAPVVGIFVGLFVIPLAGAVWAVAHAWAFIGQLMDLAITRQREHLADATAVALTGSPNALANALARISGNPRVSRGSTTVGRLCIMSPLFGGDGFNDLLSTHPEPGSRIDEIRKLPEQEPISLASEEWKGLSSSAMLLPAGAVAAVGVLALTIPLFSGSNGSNTSFRTTSSNFGNGSISGATRPQPIYTAIVTAVPTRTSSPVATVPSAKPFQYGQTGTGHLDTIGQVDSWSFSAQTGDIVTIRVAQEGGASLTPQLHLVDPSGTDIKQSSCCYGGDTEARILNFKITASGIYTISIDGARSVGGYRLTLTSKPLPKTLAYGSQGTGQIALSDDYEDWKFTAQASDIITIRVSQEGSASLSPGFDLLDPSSTKIVEAGGCSSGGQGLLGNFPLRFSGTYTIRVRSGCGPIGPVGGYRIELFLKAPPKTLALGQTVTGQITFSGDYEDTKFAAAAGDVMTITMSPVGGASLYPGFDLLDPSDTKIADAGGCSIRVAKLNVPLKFAGTYTIRARSGCDAIGPTGQYQLTITR